MKNGGKKRIIIKVIFDECTKLVILLLFKVAEHSFQVPIPNSPLLLSYLCFGARFFARVKFNHKYLFSHFG